ncbi:MAG: hypothetical protein WDN48_05985 [Pseudolabrys sp.]
MATTKITFTKDHKVKQGDGKGPHYKTGETHDLEISYAEKYKRLGLAVDYVAPKPVPRAEKAKAPQRKDGDIESVEIRQETVPGGQRTLYAAKPWPKVTRIADEMLTDPDAALVVKDGHVTITVANGFATYKLSADAGMGYRDCDLVDSKYEEAPAKK